MFGTGSFAEGIGNSMVTGNHGRAVIDDAVRVRFEAPCSCTSPPHLRQTTLMRVLLQ
jgi:hypothetical protein